VLLCTVLLLMVMNMNLRSILLISLTFFLLTQTTNAQDKRELIIPNAVSETETKADQPPGSMQLLDGYIHTKSDHAIYKPNGVACDQKLFVRRDDLELCSRIFGAENSGCAVH